MGGSERASSAWMVTRRRLASAATSWSTSLAMPFTSVGESSSGRLRTSVRRRWTIAAASLLAAWMSVKMSHSSSAAPGGLDSFRAT